MFKHKISLVVLILLCFSCVLWNGFAGDDHALFGNNSFYKNSSNIVRIFRSGYNVIPDEVLYGHSPDKGTGSVAYRPMTTMSFFFDCLGWDNRPFGYHLTSLVLHLANVLLLYQIVALLSTPLVALSAAIIFAIHPANTEPVAAIGYRSDLLACFFLLIAFQSWLYFRKKITALWAILAYTAYFLALFSKETALFFPLVIVFFDRTILGLEAKVIKQRPYWPFFFISFFYLYVYFFVFQNTGFIRNFAVGYGWQEYMSVFVQIVALYLKEICFVLSAGVMPPLYWPLPRPWLSVDMIGLAFLVVTLMASMIILIMRRTKVSWAALWVCVFFLPALVYWVNPNPVALRYMYIPFVGIAFLMATLLVYWGRVWGGRLSAGMRYFLCSAAIVSLLLPAITSNLVWRSNFSLGEAWVKAYPEHHMGYFFKGTEFFRLKKYQEAVDNFLLALKDPGCDATLSNYYLGVCYLQLGRLDDGKAAFERIFNKVPLSYYGQLGMADYYYAIKQYPVSVTYLERILPSHYTDELAINFLLALEHAEGTGGVTRGLKIIGSILGDGPRLDKIIQLSKRGLKLR